MRLRLRLVLCATLLALLLFPAPRVAAAPQRLRGPLLGHVSPTSATVWVYTGGRAGVRVWYRPDGAELDQARSAPVSTDTAGPRAARALLQGLAPDTVYVYRVVEGLRTSEHWAGRFRTPPVPGTPGRLRMAVSSCMKAEHAFQDAFSMLLREQPAFHLLLGDNVYADSTLRAVHWDKHLRMRGVWQFAQLVRNVPTYAMWDDHDFAGDNIGGAQVAQRGRLLEVFRELWANPAAGTDTVPGVFFKLTWGAVDFFVLDGRYHRSALSDANDARKRMLGDGQFAWLARELRASRAPFKVIASGSTIAVEGTDTWNAYRFELKRVWGLIRDLRLGGVLWLSGDLHEGQIETHPRARTGFYDLTEVVSSGIANSRDHEFATLDFDTTLADPTCHIRILNGAGVVVQERLLTASALRVAEE